MNIPKDFVARFYLERMMNNQNENILPLQPGAVPEL